MLSEPRTISLLCELIHIPMKHTSEKLRDVYSRVCRSCGYENFIRTPAGARIERQEREGNGFSHLNFTGDRIQFTEDHVGMSVEQFAQKVSAVVCEAVEVLRIPVIVAQQATVRVTSSPNTLKSSAEFLARRMFRIGGEDLEVLGRPASVFGLRMVFPPTKEQPHGFNVRVEPYLRDPRSFYIENVGTIKVPIQTGSPEPVEQNIYQVSQFIVEKIIPFLSRYDRRDGYDKRDVEE